MKNLRNIFLLIFLILGSLCHAQEFKPGYFIQEHNRKINCLLKVSDLSQTPKTFKYKLTKSSTAKQLHASDIIEVAIIDLVKYKRISITENSADFANNISLLCKVLVSGKATLYKFNDSNQYRYYFQIGSDSIISLPIPDSDNMELISILKNSLVCSNMYASDFDNLSYSDQKLMTLFIRYNVCQKTSYINIESKVERDYFNLYLKGGLSLYNLQNNYGDGNNDYSLNFGSQFNIAAMPEVELFLTHFKHKLAFVTGLNYLSFTSEASKGIVKSKVDYKSFELPIGFRQYFHLTDQSSVFLNAFFVSNKGFDSSVSFRDLYGQITSFNLNNLIFNYAIGAGYNYNNRWSMELRYQLPLELYPREIYWSTKFAGLNLTLAYNLFK